MSHRWRIHLARLAILTAITVPVLSHTAAAAPLPTGSRTLAVEQSVAVRPLVSLTELYAERALLADEVAAAKWGIGKLIEDLAREQQLLDDVARKSAAMGLATSQSEAGPARASSRDSAD